MLGDLNLKGKFLPGIPTRFGNFELKYTNSKKLSFVYSRNYRGTLYANDNNTEEVNSFWRDDVSLSIPVKIRKNDFDFFFGCNNILDKLYPDNIRINAFGNRYYEAAPGRIFFAGVKILI
jgi:iron complex outermembrane receptor protein